MRIRRSATALTITGGIALTAALGSGAAVAQSAPDYPGGTTDQQVDAAQADRSEVQGAVVSRGAGAVSAGAVSADAAAPAGLALTGGDVAGLTIIGVGLTAGGIVLVRRSRRRPTTA